jgi:azurin
MKNYLLLLICLPLITACGGDDNSTNEQTTETVIESPPASTIASSYATKDTLTVVASGMTMAEISFDKAEIKLPANQEITIALKNESTDISMPHNFVVIKTGTANDVGQNGVQFKENGFINPADQNVIVHSPLAQANTTIYISFKTPAAGEYEFICSYPGHWGLMKGKFITE